MKHSLIAFGSSLVLLVPAPAETQTLVPQLVSQSVRFDSAERSAATPLQGGQADRRGFTILVNLGLGVQQDEALEESAVGLAGANLGIGGFVNPKLAVMFRFSGTNVNYDFPFGGDLGQVSGVVGATIQYWASDRFALEVGGGMGFWSIGDGGSSETGPGLILGASGVVFRRGGHNLLVGAEYAPAFTDPATVHNLGFTFGYQFHKTR